MLFTVNFESTILDFRQIAIILSGLVGGIIPSLIAGFIIAVMRLLAFGSITTSTLIAAGNTLVVALAFGVVCSLNISYWKKWIWCLIIGNALTSIVFFAIFGSNGFDAAILYTLMMSIGGFFTAYLVGFLAKAKLYALRLEKEATVDFLTGLNNHRTFDFLFNSSVSNAVEKHEHLTLMLIDIDYFKKVNDTYGHPNGDTILQQVGALLKNTSRNFDDISRIGGEEFSILLFDCPHEHGLVIAERIRIAVENHPFVLNDGTQIQITISIGVASLRKTNDNDIIEQADLALYAAKQNGRNQVFSNSKLHQLPGYNGNRIVCN